jgi:hypothetical protein
MVAGMFGAEIGSDGVDDDEADVVAFYGYGELVGEDVVLFFEVWDADGEDAGKGGERGPW